VIGIGTIGPKALYLLFAWLISAAAAAWLADRKGYAERVGLTLGLLLSVVGLLVMLFLPGRPGSKWKVQGWLPRRRHPRGGSASSLAASLSGEGEDAVGQAGSGQRCHRSLGGGVRIPAAYPQDEHGVLLGAEELDRRGLLREVADPLPA